MNMNLLIDVGADDANAYHHLWLNMDTLYALDILLIASISSFC